VKKFIYDELPLFHNTEFKKIPGAPPKLLLLNTKGDTVKTIDLSDLTQDQCAKILIDTGFYKKPSKDAEVPEEYKYAPLKSAPPTEAPPEDDDDDDDDDDEEDAAGKIEL
jgi:hypothetical protein